MKNFVIFCITIFPFIHIPCQTFYNGDFENTTSTACDYNLDDESVNSKMPNVYAFGKTYGSTGQYKGETDIQKDSCYVVPQSGHWCMGIASDRIIHTTSDAVALELTSALVPGKSYKLRFYVFANTEFFTYIARVRVGESLSNTEMGHVIDTITPAASAWKKIEIVFTATLAAKFITVKNMVGLGGWNQIDNFTITETSGTDEASGVLPTFEVFPNPSSDYITIRVPDTNPYRVSLINSIGVSVFQKEITARENVIDLSGIARGIYFIQLKDLYGRIACKQIVLN